SNTIVNSTDGVNWVLAGQPGTGTTLTGVVYGNGQFVAVGNKTELLGLGRPGRILTSADGVNWIPREPETTNQLYGIAYGNGQFVAAGGFRGPDPGPLREGTILTSTDGVNWTPRLSGTTIGLHAITYGNGQFVAVGDDGNIVS